MQKYEVTINQKDYSVLVKKFTLEDAELEINGKTYSVKLDGPIEAVSNSVQQVMAPAPQAPAPQAPRPVQAPAAATTSQPSAPQPVVSAGSGDIVTAPIPGSILEVLVKEGDQVEAGQTVVKMEAMKMENDINATSSGTIKSIQVSVGDAVSQGQALVEIG
ncbi:MAG: biotin/lipoyl-binding protein [Deltaproteobacteria bacterium]|jgi:glutaconyl-CoA/methylmalonyl-CoA decarboxylase subunit gamma|nr:biotin/lipoyl-binding protein [Deltaproteobacteria bacterium]MBT6504037.1 biotin/lipoyl-binding protein [Deltaproteobacteria bacterium]MBT7710880.1 biotin/lipoyl-binding protein [Deltaproteobacteria bacterium]MBT7892700.1 biotin/lipoyl-binding protein [Deltaproteobacteria bacterium]